MLPLGRMLKTPSGPFKAGTALILDHETAQQRLLSRGSSARLALRCELHANVGISGVQPDKKKHTANLLLT